MGSVGANRNQSFTEVRNMVGEDNLIEFDENNRPNKYSPDDPRWGTEPGIYTVYRAGNLERDIVFTANTYEGSKSYAEAFPSSENSDINPDRSGVNTYIVEVKNPYVSKDLSTTYQELFGKKLRLEPTGAEIKKGITSGDLWVKADERICKKLKSKGYDAWTMTDPAPPAIREMNIFGSAKNSMVKTARKIPDSVKKKWEEEAKKNGFYSNAFKDGKRTGLTINEWFKTDAYKKGKAEGKWA